MSLKLVTIIFFALCFFFIAPKYFILFLHFVTVWNCGKSLLAGFERQTRKHLEDFAVHTGAALSDAIARARDSSPRPHRLSTGNPHPTTASSVGSEDIIVFCRPETQTHHLPPPTPHMLSLDMIWQSPWQSPSAVDEDTGKCRPENIISFVIKLISWY